MLAINTLSTPINTPPSIPGIAARVNEATKANSRWAARLANMAKDSTTVTRPKIRFMLRGGLFRTAQMARIWGTDHAMNASQKTSLSDIVPYGTMAKNDRITPINPTETASKAISLVLCETGGLLGVPVEFTAGHVPTQLARRFLRFKATRVPSSRSEGFQV